MSHSALFLALLLMHAAKNYRFNLAEAFNIPTGPGRCMPGGSGGSVRCHITSAIIKPGFTKDQTSLIKSASSYSTLHFLKSTDSEKESRTTANFESLWNKEARISEGTVATADFKRSNGNNGSLRGLRAERDFRKGEELFTLPLNGAITVTTSTSSNGRDMCCPAGLEALWPTLGGNTRLALVLLDGRMKMDEAVSSTSLSPFIRAYIESLPEPRETSTPFHWRLDQNYGEESLSGGDDDLSRYGDERLGGLPYEHLGLRVMEQRKRWRELFRKLPKGSNCAKSFQNFVWAMEMVGSRAFSGLGGQQQDRDGKPNSNPYQSSAVASGALLGAALVLSQLHTDIGDGSAIALCTLAVASYLPAVFAASRETFSLLPVIDSCNHISEDSSDPLAGPNCEMSLEPRNGGYTLTARRDIRSGDEVRISYGKRHNDELFQYFGFVERDNPYDQYVIRDPLRKLRALIIAQRETSYPLSSDMDRDQLDSLERLTDKYSSSIDKRAQPKPTSASETGNLVIARDGYGGILLRLGTDISRVFTRENGLGIESLGSDSTGDKSSDKDKIESEIILKDSMLKSSSSTGIPSGSSTAVSISTLRYVLKMLVASEVSQHRSWLLRRRGSEDGLIEPNTISNTNREKMIDLNDNSDGLLSSSQVLERERWPSSPESDVEVQFVIEKLRILEGFYESTLV